MQATQNITQSTGISEEENLVKKRDAKKLSKEDWTVVVKKGPGRPKKEVTFSEEDSLDDTK
jgi:hypothetical protein